MSQEPPAKASKLQAAIRAWVRFSFAHPVKIIGVVALLTAAAGVLAARMPFRGDFVELLPESSEEVKDLRFVEARAGGGGYLIVQVTGGEKAQRRAFAAALAPKLEGLTDLVRYVEYRFDIGFFRSRVLLLLSTEQLASLTEDLKSRITYEKKNANPLFVDLLDEQPPLDFDGIESKYTSETPRSEYIESTDGTELYLYVKPTGVPADLDFNRRLVAGAQQVVSTLQAAHPSLHIALTGPFVIRVEEDDAMKSDLQRASLLSVLFALGLILFSTRRPTAIAVVIAPVAVGVVFTFAIGYLTVGHLNPITGFLAAILVGLGIEYGVHLSLRYWEERATLSAVDAMQNAASGTLVGAITSAATNAAAFLVLVLSGFAAFRQFAIMASVGVVLTVVFAYLLAPSILAVAERLRPYRQKGGAAGESPKRDMRPLPVPALYATIAIVLAFGAFSLTVIKDVGFETDLKKLKGESRATELDDHITAQLGIIMAPALIHVESMEDARAITEIIAEVRSREGKLTSFKKAASLNDVVPTDLRRRLEAIEGLREIVRDLPKSLTEGESADKVKQFISLLDAKPYGPDDVPLEIRRRFKALIGTGTFVLLFPRYSGYDTEELKLWANDIDQVIKQAKKQGIDAHVLDTNRIAARIFTLVRQDGPFIMAAAAAVVFIMIALSLRSVKQAMLVTAPLYLGMLCLSGAMFITGVRLNVFNIVVLPNLLTIAVDNSVHLYHRYHEEGPGSLGYVVRHTGFAAAVSTLSNAAGYGALLIAHHEGMRSLATLALMGVACTFAGTTLFFPAMLALVERWRAKRATAA